MDEKKVCFVVCVNDRQRYEECLLYLQHLVLPLGIEAEVVPVCGAVSMASGYNAAMRQSQAKYKVYLHQDVYITQKDLLQCAIEIFANNDKIGMIGLTGCTKLPGSAIWWDTLGEKYGVIAQGITPEHIELSNHDDMIEDYHEVEAIDGLFMMTQYDILWREDIFAGWHFYDISQCMEFQRQGYKIVVPQQEEPWCIHDCGRQILGADYEYWRNRFLQVYRV